MVVGSAGWLAAKWEQRARALVLSDLPDDPADPPGDSRRREVPGEVWGGIRRVHAARAVQNCTVHLLNTLPRVGARHTVAGLSRRLAAD